MDRKNIIAIIETGLPHNHPRVMEQIAELGKIEQVHSISFKIPNLKNYPPDFTILKIFLGELPAVPSQSIDKLIDFHQKNLTTVTLFQPAIDTDVSVRAPVAELINVDVFKQSLRSNTPLEAILGALQKTYLLQKLYSRYLSNPQGIASRILGRIYRKQFVKKALQGYYERRLLAGEGNALVAISMNGEHLQNKAKRIRIYPGDNSDKERYLVDDILKSLPFPRSFNILISNRCNLKCIMCPIHSPLIPKQSEYFNKPRFMTLELFEKIVTEIGENGGSIKMGNIEEPLLHPDIVDFVKLARDKGVKQTHFTTNGTLLSPEMSEALLRAGANSFYISIDAATEENYNKIRGGSLSHVSENVKNLAQIRNKMGLRDKVPILTAFILQEPVIREKGLFLNQWSPIVDGVIIYQLGKVEDGRDVTDDYFIQLPATRSCCTSPWTEMYILPDGEVLTCCKTDLLLPKKAGIISMGNVREETIRDIWGGANYARLRKRLLNNELTHIPQCVDCEIWAASISRTRFEGNVRIVSNPWSEIYYFK